MLKVSLIGSLFFSQAIFGQVIRGVGEDSIYVWEGNRSFVNCIDKLFSDLKNENCDTVMLYYDLDPGNNAILISKKKGKTTSYVLCEMMGRKTVVEELNNVKLNNTSISGIYRDLIIEDIKTIDTTQLLSNDGFVFFRFYFNPKISTIGGWHSNIFKIVSRRNPLFYQEFLRESDRIRKSVKQY